MMALRTGGLVANGFTYSIVFRNQSSNEGYGCLYWTPPSSVTQGQPVAWLSKYVFATTSVTWNWPAESDFVWSETGKLQTGTKMSASQVWLADPETSNVVTLTRRNDAYTFQNQRAGSPSGSLVIQEDATIPAGQVSVGTGVGGYAAFLVQGQPNLNLVFPTQGWTLWIAFGAYPRGQVIDPSLVSNPAQLVFPANVYSLTATLTSANTWSVETTSAVNARYAQKLVDDPTTSWLRV